MGPLSDPTYAACGIKEKSALYFIGMCPTLANLSTQIFGKPILSIIANMRGCLLALLYNLQKRVVDLRLVFDKTSIMGCRFSGLRAKVNYNFTHS
jgi:hypothetical protein